MFVHTVYFWLRNDLTPPQTAAFLAGARSLTTIASVKQAHFGIPAPTDRPVIDRSYSHALIVLFENQDDHDRYQSDPIHDRFRDECGTFWKKVLIYDSIT